LHTSEYMLAVWFHGGDPKGVTWRSTLISLPYIITMCLGVLEFVLETIFWTEIKGIVWVVALGCFLLLLGEIIRKTAILTAKKSFTHDIATKAVPQHTLIQHGIYSIVRHPSYTGWLVWVIGGQVLLTNPASLVVMTLITWLFFNFRISYEEHHLRQIFEEYEDYSLRVPFSGIPFVPCHSPCANPDSHTPNGSIHGKHDA